MKEAHLRRFIGRKIESNKLERLLTKQSASLVVIRGRRRIGKSRLISEFARSHRTLSFIGQPLTKQISRQEQIDEFARQMHQTLAMPQVQTDNWGDLFWHLGQQVQAGRVIIVLDEISWIASKDPLFLGHLKTAWDLFFSQNPELLLIVCGSVSSWIQKNILSSTGFLGRITMDLCLGPLSLSDCAKFWGERQGRVSPYGIAKVLAVTGGVPRYLEEVLPHQSAEQNIRNLCFRADCLLYREFEHIFSDLFGPKASTYRQIVNALSGPAADLDELAATLNRTKGGVLSKRLQDLIQAGFVAEGPTWSLKNGKSSQLKKYRISDNYMRFYLRAIRPFAAKIEKGLFEWRGINALCEWYPWLGLQFENLVLDNVRCVLEVLDIDPSDVLNIGPYFQRPTKRHKGCQLDLLIQTIDSLYACEIKFSQHSLPVSVVSEVRDKVARLAKPRSLSVRPVLIHVNGVDQSVQQSGFFDSIIDFSRFLVRPLSS